MHHIVCLSTTAFHAFPTRKQQVMSRIPDAQILYFDPPVTYLAPLRSKAARSQLRAYREPGEQVQPNVWRYALPPILPFSNKKRTVNRMNRKRLARSTASGRRRSSGSITPPMWTRRWRFPMPP